MASTDQSFRAFERAGWEDSGVVAKYHGHLSDLTNQSIDVLLEAAAVRTGSRVLDVATGAGYVAGAAAKRGAEVTGIDFSVKDIPACGLSRPMRKRFHSTLTPSMRSSVHLACATSPIQKSRSRRHSAS